MSPELVLTEEQQALAEVVRDLLADRSPEETVRRAMATDDGIDEDTWKLMAAQLGLVGLGVPEQHGGSGGTFSEVCIVMEELGRVLACVPYFSHVVLAQSLIRACESEQTRGSWLSDLASGELRATVAFAEPDRTWDAPGIEMTATRVGQSWSLTGVKSYVVDGCSANVIFVVARTDAGLSIFSVDGDADGLTRTLLSTLDQTRKQARLAFEDVPVTLIGAEGSGAAPFERMLEAAVVGLSAESVGGAQRVLEMAVDYAKTRVQFGRQIGSFQAIKHKCADMLLKVESAKSAAYYARWALSDGAAKDEAALAAAMSKAYCQDAFADCASDNIQIHGGIGFTWEHPAHLYFKRAKANQLMFGDSILHRERVADLIGLA